MSGMTDRPAGSPTAGQPAFFDAGVIRHAHGVKGEMLVEVNRHYVGVFLPGEVVYLGEEHKPATILSRRHHNKGLLIQFEGITNPEQAGQYRNFRIYFTSLQRIELPPGEYYFDQLLGLNVRGDDSQELGKVSEIIETGANDVYVVSSPGRKDILLPAIPEVILAVNLLIGEIQVHILPGLIDDLP
jgi:16S rRNA processing protein RimM